MFAYSRKDVLSLFDLAKRPKVRFSLVNLLISLMILSSVEDWPLVSSNDNRKGGKLCFSESCLDRVLDESSFRFCVESFVLKYAEVEVELGLLARGRAGKSLVDVGWMISPE